MAVFLKYLLALAFALALAACMTPEGRYPNVVPIDTTGNYGAAGPGH